MTVVPGSRILIDFVFHALIVSMNDAKNDTGTKNMLNETIPQAFDDTNYSR
jgi:hypothetical protein